MPPRPRRLARLLPPAVALAALAACAPVRDNDALVALQGDACAADIDCGPGLVCGSDGTCQPLGDPGTGDQGDACFADGDCRFGLLCGGNGTCGDGERSAVGEECQTDRGCLDGLVCARDGLCAAPGEPGTAPDGAACEDDTTCGFGLLCGPEGTCTSAPRWPGVDCEGSALPGPPRVLFEVPRGDVLDEFYRLPYPNDARALPGGVELTGFPGAGVEPEPGELLGRYLSAIAAEGTGFGPASAVIFRFSVPVDFGSLDFGGEIPNFAFVDITEGDEAARGRSPRSRFYATGGRSRYICPNWLGIRPSEGTPLTEGHTYAVVFRRGVTDTQGTPLEAADDLVALLAATPPEHPALRAAWTRYTPLRAYLAEAAIPADDVIGAAVFTVGAPRERLATVRAAVHAAPLPVIEEVTACGGGASPCAGRSCTPMSGQFVEIHARVSLTSFLQGVPPYADWGGDAAYRDGQPRAQRQEDVCVVLTVPRGTTPAAGWPVAIFAHDLGGDAGTAIETGLAARLAGAGWATVGYDGLLHGGRYGGGITPDLDMSTALLDEPARPGLMRDQAVQGAADLFALARLLQTGLEVPTGAGPAALASDGLAFIGHGRGGVYGVPFAAYEPGLDAAVFAGVGGDLVDWLQNRRAPRDLAAELAIAFAETEFNGMHPALHLMQTWLDPRDPVNYGALLRRPPDDVPPKHILFVYGVDDPITPPSTMNHLAVAMRLARVGPERAPLSAVTVIEEGEAATAQGNVRIDGVTVTQVIKQYAPSDGDGHRVLFDHPQARLDIEAFFRGLASGDGIPPVGPQ